MNFIFKGEPKCENCPDFSPHASSYEDLFGDGEVIQRLVKVDCEHREYCEHLTKSFADKLAELVKAGYRLDFFKKITVSGRYLEVRIYTPMWENSAGVEYPLKDQDGDISNEELCSAVDAAYHKLIEGLQEEKI